MAKTPSKTAAQSAATTKNKKVAPKPKAKATAGATKRAAPADSAIAGLEFVAYLNGPTKNPVAQTTILRAIADDPLLAPTHGDVDDSKRTPFDLEALALVAGTKVGSPFLWRTRRPKYWGSIDATPQPLARMTMHFEGIDPADVEQVGAAITRMAERLRPFWAAMHFKWENAGEEQLASLAGVSAKAFAVIRNGPPGVFGWNWFGPELTKALGLGTLLQLGGTPMGNGGASLPLGPKPWAMPFVELRARQLDVDATLRKSGWFGDYTGMSVKKGPAWVSLAPLRKDL